MVQFFVGKEKEKKNKIFLKIILFSYRDFREDSAPYNQTAMFWDITAARLAFIIVFEHIIFFIIYLMQCLVPDVPKTIQNKIDHERYIDQQERWASKTTENHFKDAVIASEALSRMFKSSDEILTTSNQPRNRKRQVEVQLSSDSQAGKDCQTRM
jgi:hypothetical protein